MIGSDDRRTALKTRAVVAFASVVLAGAASAQPSPTGVYVSAARIAAETTSIKDGVAIWPAPTGPGTTLMAVRRTADGQVEVHDRLNDQIVVQSGRATFQVGGRVDGAVATAPGEWRGGRMSGAKAYVMGPGDILWIPAGVPHQALVPKGGDFRYLAFKFEAR
jgi:mannose-6-phosphate isomerase-like protein (cupin superfamily)